LGTKKAPKRFFVLPVFAFLALTRFETWIRLADNKNFAATTHNFAVTMAGFRRFQ
jgi:hypothetical protein